MYPRRCLLRNLFKILKILRRDVTVSTINFGKTQIDVEPTSKLPREIEKYFSDRGILNVVQNISKNYGKRKSGSDRVTIVDPNIARQIAFTICSRLSSKYAIESDPGLGLISEILIMAVPQLILCETDEECRLKLEKFKEKYTDKVKIVNMNFYSLMKHLSDTGNIFEDIPTKPWNDEICLSYIVNVPCKQLFRNICKNLVLNETWKCFGRPEYYFLTSDINYYKLIANSENLYQTYYRSTAVMFQLIFDYEILLSDLPREVFLPWPSRNYQRKKPGKFVLLRAVPKVNPFAEFENKNIVRSFLNFINDNIRKEKRIIPVLESYVPLCGPYFILNFDLSIYTEFIEISPEKLLNIFSVFSKLPEFSKTDLYMMTKEEMAENESESEDENN